MDGRLSKEEVLHEFRLAWADAAAGKYGDIYQERAERTVADLIPRNRDTIVEVLRDWIRGDNTAEMVLAVRLATRFGFAELLSDLRDLDADLRGGTRFQPYYAHWTREALEELGQGREIG